MNKNMLSKILIVGVIVFFIGVSVTPVTSSFALKENFNSMENKI